MNFKSILLIILLLCGHNTIVQANNFTGRGGQQVGEAIASIVVGSAVVCYAGAKLGYGLAVDCYHWVEQKGRERSAKKEEKKRIKNASERQLIEAKAREEVQSAKNAKNAAYKESTSAVFASCAQQLTSCCRHFEDIVIYSDDVPFGQEEQCFINRYNALNDHLQGNDTWTEQTYQLSLAGQKLLEEQSILHESYLTLYGNQIQHVLHKEYVDIVDRAAQFPHKHPLQALDCKNIATTVAQFAHAGQVHNHAGAVAQSFVFADFCYGMLSVSDQCFEIQCDMGNAIKKGAIKGCCNIKNGVRNVYYKLCEPYQTFKETVKGFGQLIIAAAEITDYVDTYILEHQAKMRLKARQDKQDVLTGKYTQQFIFERDKAITDKNYKETIQHVHNYLSTSWKRLDYEFSLYTLEKSTEFAIGMLPAYALKALSLLLGKGASSLNTFIESGALEKDFYSIGCNGNTLHAAVSYQALIAHEAAIALETVGLVAADVLNGASKIAPIVTVPGGYKEPLNVISEVIPNPSIDIIEATIPLKEAELNDLQQYVGLKTYNGHPVVPPFEHTWVATKAKSGKITGFHQDRCGYYRKLGLIKDVHMFEGGFYQAKVYIDGNWVERSFFPEEWSVANLMECYYSIIKENNIFSSNSLRTTYKLEYKNGVIITLVLENNGLGVTFFPNLLRK